MKIKSTFLLSVLLLLAFHVQGQVSNPDSTAIAKVFIELINICKNVDFADPKTTSIGMFYKAAPFIVYRGGDKTRAWKVFVDYSSPEEKQGVDEICSRINNSVNQDSTWKIIGYRSETESEGTWYVLLVSYMRKGVQKEGAFAFLKIGEKFGLGDVD